MLRLFIIEPLESFDVCVESDLDDLITIRPRRFAVKRNKFGAGPMPDSQSPLEW